MQTYLQIPFSVELYRNFFHRKSTDYQVVPKHSHSDMESTENLSKYVDLFAVSFQLQVMSNFKVLHHLI